MIEKIISLLAATLTQPRLILFDNFETPYITLDRAQKQVEDTLRRLAMLNHVAILITMRGRYPPCDEAVNWQSKEIQPTDEAACLLIYRSIYPDSDNDSDVGRLLGSISKSWTLYGGLQQSTAETSTSCIALCSVTAKGMCPNTTIGTHAFYCHIHGKMIGQGRVVNGKGANSSMVCEQA